MKINVDRTTAGFAAEKFEKQGKLPETAKPMSNPFFDTRDEFELTSKKAAVLNAAREASDTVQTAESGAGSLDALRQKLASVNSLILNNPAEALAAQANLNSETVAALVG